MFSRNVSLMAALVYRFMGLESFESLPSFLRELDSCALLNDEIYKCLAVTSFVFSIKKVNIINESINAKNRSPSQYTPRIISTK